MEGVVLEAAVRRYNSLADSGIDEDFGKPARKYKIPAPPGGESLMRATSDARKIEQLMQGIGRLAKGPGRVYLVGGACAVTIGWRPTTVDADLKLDPEPEGVFDAIATLKGELDMNVELAAPDDFIPPVPGWKERSRFIARHGQVDFFHYDFYAQALAKIERGHTMDLEDARQMTVRGLIDVVELARRFDAIAPDIIRYPAIDPDAFRAKVEGFTGSMVHASPR